MQRDRLFKYILDIEAVIKEIEQVQIECGNNFNSFEENFMAVRTVERNLQIIGEAVKKMLEIRPDLNFTNVKNIVRLRDLLAHQYDIVDPAILWGIIQKDIPTLKEELGNMRN
ncbi:DUF86 domain-containing protein [bacterium AH-315-C20]|nr:DUF86 domain-containing protein [bacterium AH-315-C20]